MPKKKTVPQEELEQTAAELPEQAGAEAETAVLPETPPQEETLMEAGALNDGPPGEGQEMEALSVPADAVTSTPEDPINGPEVMGVDMGKPAEPPRDIPEGAPVENTPLEDLPPAEGQNAAKEFSPDTEPVPTGEAPPLTDRQSFFALDFRELDRGLTPEERQAWNSIYASFRGRSALSGKIIGADPHSMNVRSRETGRVERRTMYCVVVLLYRIPVYIPATEMWMGEARPDYVLQNMMGASIDFIITKVDREGGYAIASRRQAARTQRYFFAHRPDLCRVGSRVKCRMLSVGPRRCLVECYGHDVDLTQRELSYTAIPDLREKYHPGDELDCVVKGYDAARRELQISVKETESNPFEGAELRHPVGSRRYAVIAGKYGGGVFCNLPDGTLCMCNYSYQHEDSDFLVGDHVMLVVHRFEPEKRQMYGKILSKW